MSQYSNCNSVSCLIIESYIQYIPKMLSEKPI